MSSALGPRHRAFLLRRPGTDRLKMACSMLAAARTLVRGSMRHLEPRPSAAAVRRALFERFYGSEFGRSDAP